MLVKFGGLVRNLGPVFLTLVMIFFQFVNNLLHWKTKPFPRNQRASKPKSFEDTIKSSKYRHRMTYFPESLTVLVPFNAVTNPLVSWGLTISWMWRNRLAVLVYEFQPIRMLIRRKRVPFQKRQLRIAKFKWSDDFSIREMLQMFPFFSLSLFTTNPSRPKSWRLVYFIGSCSPNDFNWTTILEQVYDWSY